MVSTLKKLTIPAMLTPVVFASAMFTSASLYSPPAYSAYTPAYCSDYARRVSLHYSRGGAVGGAVRGGVGQQLLVLSWVAARAPGEVPRSAPLPEELRVVCCVA